MERSRWLLDDGAVAVLSSCAMPAEMTDAVSSAGGFG